MPDTKSYERLSEETPASWQAFTDFLRLRNRSPKALHKYYETADNPPTRSKSTLANWRDRYQWTARAKDYDADQSSRQLEVVAAEQREADRVELDKYSQLHRDMGVAGSQITMSLFSSMAEYIKLGKTSPGKLQIDSLNELAKVAGIISKIQPQASEVWAKAIGVEEMLALWQEQQQ